MQNYVKKYESATFAQLFIAKCESIFIGDTFPTTNYMNWSLVFGVWWGRTCHGTSLLFAAKPHSSLEKSGAGGQRRMPMWRGAVSSEKTTNFANYTN
jgi:hypothetical protein